MEYSLKKHGHYIASPASDDWALGMFFTQLFRIRVSTISQVTCCCTKLVLFVVSLDLVI